MSIHYHILETLSTSIFFLNADMTIQYANESAETMVQESSNRLLGQNFCNCIHNLNSDAGNIGLLDACQKSLHERVQIGLYDIEISLPPPLKKRRVDCHVASIEMEAGVGLVVEVSTPDSAHIHYAERDKMNSGRTLIRGLAHEIRNPLGGIRGAAQLLSNELDSAELIQYTNIIMCEADRLSELVGRMQTSVSVNNIQEMNVHSILEHVRKLVESEISCGLSIATDYDPSLPEISGDQDQLIQAFLNILKNATDAVESQMQEKRVSIKTRIDHQILPDRHIQQQVIRVDVMDNGDGIDIDLVDHVFEPMVTNKQGGTGLGLSITAEIIRNHSGLISIESDAGLTVVSVYLKLAGNENE